MSTVRINTSKLNTNVKNAQKYLADYKKNYGVLLGIIEKNEAKLDATTLQALKTSCSAMQNKFEEMSEFVEMALDVTKDVIKEFDKVNADSAKQISKINI